MREHFENRKKICEQRLFETTTQVFGPDTKLSSKRCVLDDFNEIETSLYCYVSFSTF